VWSVMVVHNVAEVSFGASLMWTVFLLCGVAVPCSARAPEFKAQRLSATRRVNVPIHLAQSQNRDRAGTDVSWRATSKESPRWRSRMTVR
jgi:hypothetical protein